jgi:hypothetical protein
LKIINLVTQICSVAGSTDKPATYGQIVANWLFPDMLLFNPQLPASFGFAGINGRRLQSQPSVFLADKKNSLGDRYSYGEQCFVRLEC